MRRTTIVALATMAFVLVATAAFAVLPPGGTFKDDNGNPHEGNIEAIAAIGVTKGCNPPANDLYCPDRTVTRDEMASFFSRAFGIASAAVDQFSDDNGNTHEAQINGIAIAGVTKGCNPPANTEYCPKRILTKGEVASFLARQLKLPVPTTDYFTDDNGTTHESQINAIAAAGIAVPSGTTTYGPNLPLRRDVMATMLARALDLAPIFPPGTDPGPQPPALPSVTTAQDLIDGKIPAFGQPGGGETIVMVGEATRRIDQDDYRFADATGEIRIDIADDLEHNIPLNTCMIIAGIWDGNEVDVAAYAACTGFLGG